MADAIECGVGVGALLVSMGESCVETTEAMDTVPGVD